MTDREAMRVTTMRDVIRGVADRWRAQYERHAGRWTQTLGGDSSAVHARLVALDLETATPADVAAIIGNTTWTDLACDQCGTKVDAAVAVGQPGDDEYRPRLCLPCVTNAAAMLARRAA